MEFKSTDAVNAGTNSICSCQLDQRYIVTSFKNMSHNNISASSKIYEDKKQSITCYLAGSLAKLTDLLQLHFPSLQLSSAA